jgi:hypothetical protein
MTPWYKGFSGEISLSTRRHATLGTPIYDIRGVYVIDKDQDDVLEITELPVRRCTADYKTILENMARDMSESDKASYLSANKRKDRIPTRTIDDLREFYTQNHVHFWVQTAKEKLADWEKNGESTIYLSWMVSVKRGVSLLTDSEKTS